MSEPDADCCSFNHGKVGRSELVVLNGYPSAASDLFESRVVLLPEGNEVRIFEVVSVVRGGLPELSLALASAPAGSGRQAPKRCQP